MTTKIQERFQGPAEMRFSRSLHILVDTVGNSPRMTSSARNGSASSNTTRSTRSRSLRSHENTW
jgi:hypothetical protein